MDDNNTNTMGPDSDSGGEAIIICIDHTTHKQEYFKAQLEAVRIYATHKIQAHPRTVVGLLTTCHAAFHQRFLVRPTRDLVRLFDSFEDIKRGYSFGMIDTLSSAFFMLLCKVPKGLQKRIVMFAGGIITMGVESAANPLKREGVAVDVVNFTLGDILDSRKETLEAFVAAVNTDGKTHIIHVNEGSSLSNLLSSFMPGDALVEANEKLIHSKKAIENETSSVMVKGMKNKNELIHLKKTTRLSSKKKPTENENVSSSKGAVGHEHVKLQNRFEALSISTESKGTENENVSSKGAVGDEYVKNAPSKLQNRLKHSRSLGQVWLPCLIVCFLASLLMCAA